MNKTEKTLFVEDLSEKLKKATAVVLVDYTGLTVKLQQELKNRLSQVNTEMAIVKNTLLKLASESAKNPKEVSTDEVLSGPTALIITEDDPIAPLQVLAKFAKENDLITLKVGIVEGNFQNKESLQKLATLPSKEILLSQVVGGIGSPLYGIVSVLQSNMTKLVYILDQAAKKQK